MGLFGIKGAAEKTRDHEFKLAEYQYSKDLDLWNQQNEYNTPAAQMKRLEEAGLNKNMVYGSGSVAGNTAGQTPKYQAPSAKYVPPTPSDVGAMISGYQDVRLKAAQLNNIESQTAITQQKTMNEAIRNSIMATQASKAGFDLKKATELYPYQREIQATEVEQEKKKLEGLGKLNNLRDSQKANIDADVVFKKYRNILAKNGIYTSDNKIFRVMIQAANEAGISVKSVMDNLKTYFKN